MKVALKHTLPGLLLALAACGDGGEVSPPVTPSGAATRTASTPDTGYAVAADSVRARKDIRLARADFLKPAMVEQPLLDPYQAPLFYRELATPDDPTHPLDGFGRLERDADGLVRADTERPAVYFERTHLDAAGSARAGLAFLWFRNGDVPGEVVAQGVRITSGADGEPMLYEVLRDSTGLDVLFVGEPVEAAAVRSHGAPLDGRAYASERSVAEAPDAVVAAVTEVGPMSLGPFLYLTRGSGDVVGLHCRCEASRVEEIRGNVEYELIELARARELGVEPPAWSASDPAALLRLPAEPVD